MLYLFLVIFSFKKSNIEYSGTYESVEYNTVERGLLFVKNQKYSVGNQLVLKKDSTFEYTTCTIFSNGVWDVNQDTVLLNYHIKRYRNDSLQKAGWNGVKLNTPNEPDIFISKNNTLSQESVIEHNGKNYNFLIQLSKVNQNTK